MLLTTATRSKKKYKTNKVSGLSKPYFEKKLFICVGLFSDIKMMDVEISPQLRVSIQKTEYPGFYSYPVVS